MVNDGLVKNLSESHDASFSAGARGEDRTINFKKERIQHTTKMNSDPLIQDFLLGYSAERLWR